jgi:hypothetical protein
MRDYDWFFYSGGVGVGFMSGVIFALLIHFLFV